MNNMKKIILFFICVSLCNITLGQSVNADVLKKINAKIDTFSNEYIFDSHIGKGSITPFNRAYSIVIDKHNKRCLINKKGDLLYNDSAEYMALSKHICRLEYRKNKDELFYIILDSLGKPVIFDTTQYQSYCPTDKGIITYKINQEEGPLLGVLSSSGKEIFPCKYKHIRYIDNHYIVDNVDLQEALADKNGQFKTEFKYKVIGSPRISSDGIREFQCTAMAEPTNGHIFTAQNEERKWGVIDDNGRIIIPFIFDQNPMVKFWNGKLSFVKGFTNQKGQIYDGSGKKICDIPYHRHTHLWRDCAIIIGNEKTAIDYTDKIIGIDGKETDHLVINNDRIWYFNNKKWTLKDAKGNTIAGPYDKYQYFGQGHEENLFIVGNGGKYGMIDNAGNVIMQLKYESVDFLKNGNLTINENGGFRYFTRNGTPIEMELVKDLSYKFYFDHEIEPEYIWYENMQGKWGLCRTKDMKVIVPFVCDKAGTELMYGMALAYYNGRPYYINEQGEGLPSKAYKQTKKK